MPVNRFRNVEPPVEVTYTDLWANLGDYWFLFVIGGALVTLWMMWSSLLSAIRGRTSKRD